MPSVGEILAAERRRQGKSLNDAVDSTKIRSRLLDALEGGRYEELPSPAYVKGYIQSYARFLEIPVEPLLEQFRTEASALDRIVRPSERYLDIPHETLVPPRERAHAIPQQVWIITAAAALIVLLLVCGLAQFFSGGGTTPMPTKPKGSQGTTASPGGDAATSTTSTVAKTYKLRITARKGQGSWIRVMVDGLQGYEGTLQNGESREWLVSDVANLSISKPSALVVARDGKSVNVPKTGDISQIALKAGE
jgi:cytoskeletal protein RodZ